MHFLINERVFGKCVENGVSHYSLCSLLRSVWGQSGKRLGSVWYFCNIILETLKMVYQKFKTRIFKRESIFWVACICIIVMIWFIKIKGRNSEI